MKSRCCPPGFSFVELLVVTAVLAVVGAIAVPALTAAMQSYALRSTTQSVGAIVRSARLQAIAKNRTMRIRFNCPAAGQFRVVEVVGDPAIDNAVNRCDPVAYPFPDTNPAARPDVDAPVGFLPEGGRFGAVQDLEFDRAGTMTPLTGCPACTAVAGTAAATLNVGTSYATRTITISRRGQVQIGTQTTVVVAEAY